MIKWVIVIESIVVMFLLSPLILRIVDKTTKEREKWQSKS